MLQNTVDQNDASSATKGAPVTWLVINAITKRIVMANDRTIWDQLGFYLSLSYD